MINDKRKQRITFAGRYYVAGQQLMVKTDNTKIKGPADLKANPDQKVCSVTGSTPSLPGGQREPPWQSG